jgi:hypothetical protein
MTVYYTKEKAKFGGVSGTIIPYVKKMPTSNDPGVGEWKEFLPAGFLRCNGEIFKAVEYPVLASILGLGDDCKFKKDDQELAADEFQLPDLGSKYVLGGNSSGAYLNTRVLNEEGNNQYRVGCEIEVTSLVGTSKEISYGGVFTVVGQGEISFIGNPTFSTTTSDGKTLNAFLGEQNFQAHGHEADVGVFSYLGKWTDSAFIDSAASNGANDGQNEGSNELITIDAPTGSSAVVSHGHLINFPDTATITTNNQLRYSFEDFPVDAFGLKSTVTITTNNIFKLDEATPPYILVEYLIKI